jgi:hypothetical protein
MIGLYLVIGLHKGLVLTLIGLTSPRYRRSNATDSSTHISEVAYCYCSHQGSRTVEEHFCIICLLQSVSRRFVETKRAKYGMLAGGAMIFCS